MIDKEKKLCLYFQLEVNISIFTEHEVTQDL